MKKKTILLMGRDNKTIHFLYKEDLTDEDKIKKTN